MTDYRLSDDELPTQEEFSYHLMSLNLPPYPMFPVPKNLVGDRTKVIERLPYLFHPSTTIFLKPHHKVKTPLVTRSVFGCLSCVYSAKENKQKEACDLFDAYELVNHLDSLTSSCFKKQYRFHSTEVNGVRYYKFNHVLNNLNYKRDNTFLPLCYEKYGGKMKRCKRNIRRDGTLETSLVYVRSAVYFYGIIFSLKDKPSFFRNDAVFVCQAYLESIDMTPITG